MVGRTGAIGETVRRDDLSRRTVEGASVILGPFAPTNYTGVGRFLAADLGTVEGILL